MKNMKRLLSFVLALVLVAGLLPMPVRAEGCTHHTTHDAACGYAEPTEEKCDHVCGDGCTVSMKDCKHSPCDGSCGAGEGGECLHQCSDECWLSIPECQHQHGDCNFVPSSQGSPCKFDKANCTDCNPPQVRCEDHDQDKATCTVCAVQAMIDALPETVTTENAAQVEAQLTAIDDAMSQYKFGDAEKAALNTARFENCVAQLGNPQEPVYVDEPLTGNITLDISNGNIEIYSDGYKQGDTEVNTANGVTYTITGNKKQGSLNFHNTKLDGASVENPAYSATFQDLTIENSQGWSAVKLYNGVTLNLTVQGNNSMIADNHPGVQIEPDNANSSATLNIVQVNGSLTLHNTSTNVYKSVSTRIETKLPSGAIVCNANSEKYEDAVSDSTLVDEAKKQKITIASAYTVTYNVNGGTGTVTDSNSPYGYGNTVTVLASTGLTAPAGKAFGGWNTMEDGTGTTYQPGETFQITANTSLYALWTEYTQLSAPGNPVWDGIMAKWDAVTNANGYSVQLYKDNTAKGDAVSVTEGTSYTFAITESGSYSFKVNALGNGTTVLDSSAAESPVATVYTVTFNMNGHGAALPNQMVLDGSKVIKPADPIKYGYGFGGWYTDEACTDGNEFDFDTVISDDITLYAKWTAVTSFENVTLDIANGIIEIYADGYKQNDVSYPTQNVTYTITGTGNKKSLNFHNTRLDGTDAGNTEYFATFRNLTINYTEYWSAVKLDNGVTLNLTVQGENSITADNHSAIQTDGGSSVLNIEAINGYLLLDRADSNSRVAISDNITTTVPGGIVVCGADGSKISDAVEGTTLTDTAKNQKITLSSGYIVSFETNGGTKVPAQYLAEGGQVTKPADPQIPGAEFGGWYLDDGCTTEYFFSSYVAANITLYAKWNLSHSHDGVDYKTPWFGTMGEKSISADSDIVLTEDVTFSGALTINSGVAVNLCLNGKTLAMGSSYIHNSGTLTICDCSDGKTGKITGSHNWGVIDNYGTTEIKSGSIIGSDKGIYNNTDDTVKVSGGSISGEDYGIYGSGTITVSSGSVSGTGTSADGIYNLSGTVKVSGGSVSGTERGIYNGSAVVAEVSGGSVTGGYYGIYGSGTIKVSGGTVSADDYYGIYNGGKVYLSGTPTIQGDDDHPDINCSNTSSVIYATATEASDSAAYTGDPLTVKVNDPADRLGSVIVYNADADLFSLKNITAYILAQGEGDNANHLVLKEAEYTVTFDPNGGTGTAFTKDCVKDYYDDLYVEIPWDHDFAKEGYTFMGWSNRADYAELVNAGISDLNWNDCYYDDPVTGPVDFYPAGTQSNYMPVTKDTTEYAIWAKNMLDVDGDDVGDYPLLAKLPKSGVNTLKVLESYSEMDWTYLSSPMTLDLNGKTISHIYELSILENATINGSGGTLDGNIWIGSAVVLNDVNVTGYVAQDYDSLTVNGGTYGGLIISSGTTVLNSGTFTPVSGHYNDDCNGKSIVIYGESEEAAEAALLAALGEGKQYSLDDSHIKTAEISNYGFTTYIAYFDQPVSVIDSEPQDISITVDMSGIALTDKVYDGQAIAYTGEASAQGYSGSFLYEWYDGDTKLIESPKKPGTYTLKARAVSSGYTGEGSKTVTISKAALTVKADNKQITAGEAVPALTYTVTGLAAGDTFTNPTLTTVQDTNTVGTFEILISGGTLNVTDCYDVTYQKGTLTVTAKEDPKPSEPSEPVEYQVTKGAGQTVYKGKSATFATDADENDLVKVVVDGKTLSKRDYQVTRDGKIRIRDGFIEKLRSGKHTVTFIFEDGEAETTFRVKVGQDYYDKHYDSDSPKTGDTTNNPLWLAIALIGIAGLLTSIFGKKYLRKRR